MVFELTDEARKEWERKLERSSIAKHLLPYVAQLEKCNPHAWDRLVMLMLDYGDVAFIWGLSAVLDVDPDSPTRPIVDTRRNKIPERYLRTTRQDGDHE